MINLVLNASCPQIGKNLLLRRAVLVDPGNFNIRWAGDISVLFRDRQTAFFVNARFICRRNNLRVEHNGGFGRRVFGLFTIQNDQSGQYPDLRRGKPNARGGIHRFQHVVRQLLERSIDIINRSRDFFQPWGGMQDNRLDHGAGFRSGLRALQHRLHLISYALAFFAS